MSSVFFLLAFILLSTSKKAYMIHFEQTPFLDSKFLFLKFTTTHSNFFYKLSFSVLTSLKEM